MQLRLLMSAGLLYSCAYFQNSKEWGLECKSPFVPCMFLQAVFQTHMWQMTSE